MFPKFEYMLKIENERSAGRLLMTTYSVLYLFFVGAIVALGFYFYQKTLKESEEKLYSVIASLVVESVNKVGFSGRYHSGLLLEELARKNSDIEYIYILDPFGDTIADSGLEGIRIGSKTDSRMQNNSSLLLNDRDMEKNGSKISIKEIEVPYVGGYLDEYRGEIYIGISTESLHKGIREGVWVFTLFFIGVLPLGLYIIYKTSQIYQNPVKRLASKFEGVMEYAPLPIVFYDREGGIVEMSRAFREAFFAQGEYKSIYRINSDFASDRFRGEDREVFTNGIIIESRGSIAINDKEHHFLALKIPVIKNKNDVAVMALILNDVTKLIEREIELEQSKEELESLNHTLEQRVEEELRKNREKDDIVIKQSRFAAMGEMSSNIAHNWRQPLAIIGAALLNIGDSYEDGSLTKEYLHKELEIANKTLERLSKTIDDFREFFRPPSVKSRFRIAKEIERAIKLIEAGLISKNIILLFEQRCECEAYGYPNEFSQVVLNIISNARDALMEHPVKDPKIEIYLYSSGDNRSTVDIIDNAGGIEEELVHKVFEPYFTTKPVDKGSGVGLFMSKSIIEKNMDGRLTYIKDNDRSIFRIEV